MELRHVPVWQKQPDARSRGSLISVPRACGLKFLSGGGRILKAPQRFVVIVLKRGEGGGNRN